MMYFIGIFSMNVSYIPPLKEQILNAASKVLKVLRVMHDAGENKSILMQWNSINGNGTIFNVTLKNNGYVNEIFQSFSSFALKYFNFKEVHWSFTVNSFYFNLFSLLFMCSVPNSIYLMVSIVEMFDQKDLFK